MASKAERRRRRSINTTQALCYQLDVTRRAASLQGIVLADEDGVCLAAAGDTDACDEVAAQMSLIGRKTSKFTGVLLAPQRAWEVVMQSFAVDGHELYLCAIGGTDSTREGAMRRSIGGAERILRPTSC